MKKVIECDITKDIKACINRRDLLVDELNAMDIRYEIAEFELGREEQYLFELLNKYFFGGEEEE